MIRINRETGEPEKRCCCCKGFYPLNRFAKDRTHKVDGLYPRCKMCEKDRKAAYRARMRKEQAA